MSRKGFCRRALTSLSAAFFDVPDSDKDLTPAQEKRAKVGDALRGGISWRCRVAINSLLRKGYATDVPLNFHPASGAHNQRLAGVAQPDTAPLHG